MTYAKYHDELRAHFGSRLRYVYLHRDPRDVALSFRNAVVGDSHIYCIMKAWREIQDECIKIIRSEPNIIHVVTYEQLLADQRLYVKLLFDFFGFPFPEEDVMHSHESREAVAAAKQSSLWANLTKADDNFKRNQLCKWLHPDTGLKNDEILLVESLVHDVMVVQKYPFHVINADRPPVQYTAAEIAEFERLNKEGNSQKKTQLQAEDPADFARRMHQEEVLTWMDQPPAAPIVCSEMQNISSNGLQLPQPHTLPPVFFMVGSQRSGSNWLRVMLNQSAHIAAPHPPHILKQFKPILVKYGDLQCEDNFLRLLDHVCTFVERNPVPWVDKNENPILFDRTEVRQRCSTLCQQTESKKNTLVCIFHALMDIYTEVSHALY